MESKIVQWLLVTFFLINPFALYLQVMTGQRAFSIVPSLLIVGILFVFFVCIFLKNRRKNYGVSTFNDFFSIRIIDFIMIFIVFMTGCWLILSVLFIDSSVVLSKTIRYLIPFLLYFIGLRYLNKKTIFYVTCAISLSSVFVSAEICYEVYFRTLNFDVTQFEKLFSLYAQEIGGGDSSPISLKRPTGIIEHVHATGAYIAIGLLSSVVVYMNNNKKFFLVFAVIDFIGLMLTTARAPIVALTVAVLIVLVMTYKKYNINLSSKKILIHLFKFGLLMVIAIVFISVYSENDFFNSLGKIMGSFYDIEKLTSQYVDVQPMIAFQKNIDDYLNVLKENPSIIFFGAGVINPFSELNIEISDDYYFITLLFQFGIIGLGMLFTVPLVLLTAYKNMKFNPYSNDDYWVVFSMVVVLLILLSSLHSGVIVRKAIFPVYFIALAVLRKYLPNGKLIT